MKKKIKVIEKNYSNLEKKLEDTIKEYCKKKFLKKNLIKQYNKVINTYIV